MRIGRKFEIEPGGRDNRVWIDRNIERTGNFDLAEIDRSCSGMAAKSVLIDLVKVVGIAAIDRKVVVDRFIGRSPRIFCKERRIVHNALHESRIFAPGSPALDFEAKSID